MNCHFDVKIYNDLNDQQIIDLTNKQVNKNECKDYDTLILYIDWHGIRDSFMSSKSKIIQVTKITDIFRYDNCYFFGLINSI